MDELGSRRLFEEREFRDLQPIAFDVHIYPLGISRSNIDCDMAY